MTSDEFAGHTKEDQMKKLSIQLSQIAMAAIALSGVAASANQLIPVVENQQKTLISGNCSGEVTLLRNDHHELELMIRHERCSEVIIGGETVRLTHEMNSYGQLPTFQNVNRIIVQNGDLIAIKGERYNSEPTTLQMIAIQQPTPTPTPIPIDDQSELVVSPGETLYDAVNSCENRVSVQHPELGRGHQVGRFIEVSADWAGEAIVCDRGGVLVPSSGNTITDAISACHGPSSHFPELSGGRRVGLSLQTTGHNFLVVCQRRLVNIPAPQPVTPTGVSSWTYFTGATRVESQNNGAYISLDSESYDRCGGRVRLLPTINYLGDNKYMLQIQGSKCNKLKVGFQKQDGRLNTTMATTEYNLVWQNASYDTPAGFADTENIGTSRLDLGPNGMPTGQLSIVLYNESRTDTQQPAYETLTIDPDNK